MKKLIVHPHMGVGPFRFGMSREDIHASVRDAPKRLRRGPYALNDEDLFEALSVNVMYDEHERCHAIGVARDIGVALDYEGYPLFGYPARAVREWARARDPGLDPAYGFTSKVLGLHMSAEWIDVPDAELEFGEMFEPAQAFVVFRPGYWEDEAARLAKAKLIPG